MSPLLDRESLNFLKSFVKDKFPKIVDTYFVNAEKYFEAINQGVANQNAQEIADAAHPLKSSSGNLGLTALSELNQNIETAANKVVSGEDNFESLSPLIDDLQSVFPESLAQLKAELD